MDHTSCGMNMESKRTKALTKGASELSSFAPLSLAAGVLYGTCVAGEGYVVFGNDAMDYFKPKSAPNSTAMRMKFLCYRAVAAGAAFYVPPPLTMPSQSQRTQLRALRFIRLGVAIGTIAIVATSATWAYRQGVKEHEDEVLEGVLPINFRGNSPYLMNGNLVLRLGKSTEVTAMLRDFDRGGPRPLPVLINGRPGEGHGEYVDKKRLRAAVKSVSRGLNKGCYLRQDALGAVLSLPKAEGRKVIVQVGGWDSPPRGLGGGISKRGQARNRHTLDRVVRDLQSITDSEVAVVLLRNGAREGTGASSETTLEIDARLPLLCEVVRWVDKRSRRRRIVATSFIGGEDKEEDKGEEWLVVEQVGSKAREIAMGAWVKTREAHEQTASSLSRAWQRVRVYWIYERFSSSSGSGLVVRVQEGLSSLAEGTGKAVQGASRAVYEGGAQAWSNAEKAIQQFMVASLRTGQNQRRSVLIDAGESRIVSWWWPGTNRAPPPLSHYLCGGLRTAGVMATLITEASPESLPQCKAGDVQVPLVLVCHEGTGPRAELKAREAAAAYRSRGYEVCVVVRSTELVPLSSGVARISTEAVARGVWAAASQQISKGKPLGDVHKALHQEFDKTLCRDVRSVTM